VNASAGFSGVSTCASVWSCPKCAADIQAKRAQELKVPIAGWLDKGMGLAMLTTTVQHHKGQTLADVWGVVTYGSAAITTGAVWNGVTKKRTGSRVKGLAERYGIHGWSRTVEVTITPNGWHVHCHFLLFTDKPLTPDEASALNARVFRVWRAAVQRKGFDALPGVGTDLRVWGSSDEDVAAATEYVNKGTYRAATWASAASAAAEGRMGAYKKARKGPKGWGRTPFGLLADLVAATDLGLTETAEYSADRALWTEWETVSAGKRQTSWSKGIRTLLALVEEAPSEEVLAHDDVMGGETVCTFLAGAWMGFSAVWSRPANLLTIAETEGPDAARDFAGAWLVHHEDKRRTRGAGAAECDCNHKGLGRRAHLEGCARRTWANTERARDLPDARLRVIPAYDVVPVNVDAMTGEIRDVLTLAARPAGTVVHVPGPSPRPCFSMFDEPEPEPAYNVPDDAPLVAVGTSWDGRDLARLARSLGLAS
jgi:hypothetical protein